MSKISSVGDMDINIHNLSWIDQFGAVFDWTPAQHSAAMRRCRVAVRDRKLPADLKSNNILITFSLITFLGFLSSIVVILTIMRQPYVDPYSNLVAGIILGWSGLSVTAIICGSFVRRFAKPADMDFLYTNIRIGIENNILWICKKKMLYIYPDTGSFYRLIKVDDFLIVFVSKTAAHFLPCRTLEKSEEGRKVLRWFDANWPEDTGFDAVSGDGSAVSWVWRLKRRVGRFMLVFIPGMIAVYGVQYVLDSWREMKRQEAISSLPAPYEQRSLTGSDAVKFLYSLTHPGGK